MTRFTKGERIMENDNVVVKIGKYRWFICALLFFATTINYLDRQILSLCKEFLDKDMGWSNQFFGWINAAFQAAYGLGLLAFGVFVDKYGTKVGYTVSIISWSLAAIAYWFVRAPLGFLGVRMWVGLGEAGNFPSAIKATALWFPKCERAFSTSIFNSGCNVAGIIAPAIIPPIALAFNTWRAPYVAVGIAGFIWLIFWLIFYGLPQQNKRVNRAELNYILSDHDDNTTQKKAPWLSLLKYRATWSFITAKFMTDPVWWFFLIWLPDYFKKTRGLDVKHSWVHLVTIYAIITVLSICGGWITGHLIKKGWTVSRARKTGMLGFALCVLPIIMVTHVGDWTAVVMIGIAGAAHQAWSANLFTTVSDMFPKSDIASVIGIGGMAGSLGGMLFPPAAGALIDHFQAAGNVTGGYAILFGFCAFAYLVSFAIHHALAPKFEPFAMKEQNA
ncbi:MAG: MFS transporter [bacterium]